jgi:repressor LexA
MNFFIKEAREKAGFSQKELAEIVGVAPNTFHGYESGKHDPKSDLLVKIAQACNVSVDYLLGISGQSYNDTKKSPSDISEEAKKIAKDYDRLTDHGKGAVRLIMEYEGKAEAAATPKQAAGRPKVVPLPKVKRAHGFTEIEVFDQPAAAGLGNPVDIPPSHTEQYPSDYVPPKTNFGVLISGTSMEPKIPDGSTVFVQATPALDNGEIGIFVLDGKSYCKQLKKDEETVILHSLNPDAEDVDVPPLSELRTLGRVLGGYDPYTRDIIW